MNLEGLTLTLLTKYLTKELLGSKIYKIFMPTPHSLLLLVRRDKDTSALLADLNGGSPALYIPDVLPENPDTPPAFCMLLRKHLEEGRITRIYQNGLDRVINLEIDLLGGSSKIITKKLIFELTGKNSNIIFTQDDIILDSVKHIGSAQNSYRCILPGKPYLPPPPQQGLALDAAVPEAIADAAKTFPAANILKGLVAVTTGIGKFTAQELLAAADIMPAQVAVTEGQLNLLAKAIADLQQTIAAGNPVYAVVSAANQVKTILPLPPRILENGMRSKEFATINEAVNYAVSLKPIQLPVKDELQKNVAAETTKLTKKLNCLRGDLETASDADQQRVVADTIMANIYQLAKGMTSAELINIYDSSPLRVELSPELTPTENAQSYYKRYNKYKRAQSEIRQQITETQEMLAYLETLEASLFTAVSKTEIEEIRQEMIAAGLVRAPGRKKNKNFAGKPQPLQIKLSSDTSIYIGKNNKQNDYVTFTIGGPRDLWLHTKNIPGSHVILKTTLPSPEPECLQLAAEFAAYFSKARGGSKVPVDCAPRRCVKKPNGSKPGFVIFTNQTTYYVTPDEEKLLPFLK